MHSRRTSATPAPIVVRANANDGDLIKQWIVYLIGQQADGPLSAYSLPDPSTSSMFGALTSSVSPSRSGRSPSMAGGNSQPIPVSKNISSEVVRPLRLVGQDLAELVRDLSVKEAHEKNLTRRARQGEVIYEDMAAGQSLSRTTLQREPTVDVEDLDAFLSADAPAKNNAPTTTSAAGAATSGANKSPPTIDKRAVDVVCTNISKESSVLLQDPSSQQRGVEASSSGSSGGGGGGGGKKREVGRSEADAYQHAQLTLDSSRKSLAAVLEKFISLHNDRLAQVFYQGGAVGLDVSDVNKTLLAAKTQEELQGLIEAYAAESSKAAREDGAAFAKARDDLVAVLEQTNASIAECEALSLRGALAEEMARIEDRLRQAARRGATAVKRSQHRLDEIRPVLDAAMPLEDGSSLSSFTETEGGDSPSTLAATREPREVLSSLNNAMKTQIEPFTQRTRDVFMQRVASVEERQDDVCPGESVVAYQQARRQHLLQSTEDMKAVAGVIQRQLGTLRSVFESRDRPAAQAEHDKWLAYSKSMESIRNELLRNLEARIRYDEETAGMRSAQREKLPPPPARYVVRLPDAPSDPRPDNARGGLHNLPRTWRERYARMPAAALLSAQPKELWTPEQKAEEERRLRLEGASAAAAESETSEGHHPYANIAVDMVPESEKLRHELRVTLNKKKAREQCHAALERQLVALMAAEAAREASESAPLSPNSAAASVKAPSPPPAVNYAASEAARKALFEVLRKYS